MASTGLHGVRDRPDVRPKDAPSAVRRRLTTGYLLALGLIASLTVMIGYTQNERLEMMKRDAEIINIAGAQRMLSQRTAALASDLLADDAPVPLDALEALDDALDRLWRSHVILTQRYDGPAHESDSLRAHYFADDGSLDAALRRFHAGAKDLASRARTNAPIDPAQVAALRSDALGPLLAALNAAVTLHQQASEHRLAETSRLHAIKVAVVMITLLLEAVFLFRPLVARVTRQAAALEKEARVDSLTGLLNRSATVQALASTMASGESIAVVAIDLDHFKEVNDADGHEAGDALLRAAATRLRETVRQGDTVGRLGGDEFVAFMSGVTEAEAAGIVTRIRDALHEPVPHQGRNLRLGATVGFAMAPADATCPKLLLRIADEALIRAKHGGRGSIGRGSRDDAERLLRTSAIVKAFDEAGAAPCLAGVAVHFQPVVSFGETPDQSVPVAFEALARWSHPALGPVPTMELLDSIGPVRTFRLCHDVRAAALADFARMRGRLPFPARLALNLSAGEVARGDIALEIARQVEEASLPLSAIDIEITEEVLLDRVSDRTLADLVTLRHQGARLVLDDFGTGNSSLAHLLRLPLDGVKIDRRFVASLGTDRRAEEIIQATIGLARGLGLDVVAEGVETEAQAARLRAMGCRQLQGYLFARPMDSGELGRWLETTFGPPRPRIVAA